MTATKLSLPLPTNRTTLRSPSFRNDGEKVVVEYDYEEDDGSSKSTVLVFSEVLDFEYRQMPCCDACDILASTEMLCFSQSERLAAVLNKWQKHLGCQAKQGASERFKHFKLYFDDVGCIDLVATGFHNE